MPYAERFPPTEEPWTHAYVDRHRDFVAAALHDADLLARFETGDRLPAGYGIGFDERIVELPWLCGQGLSGRVLDAGSALNHPHLLDHIIPRVDELHIVTLKPEETAFPERQISYVFSDLRSLPYRDHLFDHVVCVSTLEHVGMDNRLYGVDEPRAENPDFELGTAVAELRRVLISGGFLTVTVPYGAAEDHGWFRQFGRAEADELLAEMGTEPVALSVYAYSAEGWQISDLDAASNARYRDFLADSRPVADAAVAARAVLCVRWSF